MGRLLAQDWAQGHEGEGLVFCANRRKWERGCMAESVKVSVSSPPKDKDGERAEIHEQGFEMLGRGARRRGGGHGKERQTGEAVGGRQASCRKHG